MELLWFAFEVIIWSLMLGSVLLGIYIAVHMVRFYRATSGTWKERLLATARSSHNMLVGYAVVLGSAVINGLNTLVSVMQMPEVQAYMQQFLDPKTVGIVLSIIGFVSMIAAIRRQIFADPTVSNDTTVYEYGVFDKSPEVAEVRNEVIKDKTSASEAYVDAAAVKEELSYKGKW